MGIFFSHTGDGTDGLCYGCRFANTAGFDNYIVETVHFQDVIDLFYQVHLQCTADTAVLESHETVVFFTHDTTFLYEVGIDIDFSYIVDYYGEFDTAFVGEDMVDQSCFSTAQVTGQEQYRYFFCFHNCM